MAFPITIQGTVIQFPSDADSPDWSPAVIQFAQLVATALSGVVGPYDVAPYVYTMVADTNTNVALPNLTFPDSAVRAAFIRYSVSRSNSSSENDEAGNIVVVYNTLAGTWEMIQSKVGITDITFSIANDGQVQFSSTGIGGTSPIGTISYKAEAVLQQS